MCGIAGFVGGDPTVDDDISAALLRMLGDRGPDGAWHRSCGPARLAQTRLAIIDLSPDVVYPMGNETQDLWLVFNGEIYNHHELRRELRSRGHHFSTDCDAEVVVHGYEEWGDAILRRLNGMFALAIADERRGELLLARDRFGIKPLVHTTGDPFAFSSSALSLVRAGLSAGDIDLGALRQYATLQFLVPPSTGLEDVRQVEPGTLVRRRADGRLERSRWAAPPFGDGPGPGVVVEEADLVLREAVRRQLEADVPVGIFLSSGIDSALMLSYAVELGARPQAFTVGFRGAGDYDEAEMAGRLAREFGVSHHVDVLSGSFGDTIGEVSAALDMPLGDASMIATLAVSRRASLEVKVVLSGTGGDDTFAGYYRHRAHRLQPLLNAVPRTVVERLARLPASQGDARAGMGQLAASYARRLAAAGGDDPVAQYLGIWRGASSQALHAALRFPLEPDDELLRLADAHGLTDAAGGTLETLQRYELATYLPGDLLVKEDRASMRAGLEARVPLLDEEVVALAERTTTQQRIELRRGKVLLRQVARRRLPTWMTRRRKRGFAVPLGRLLRDEWRTECESWLRAGNSGLVDRGRTAELLATGEHAEDVWALSVLCAWEERVASERRQASRP
jgi:asparagine synthase (glutamine-hydrolysing)